MIARNVTITGPGMSNLRIQGNGNVPLLTVDVPGGLVVISGLTLGGGHATGGGYGGNLQVVHMGIMALTNVALVDGTADAGLGGAGAYIGSGYVTLSGVTVRDNSAPGSEQYATGAGLYIDEAWGDTVVTIKNSQIYGNVATGYGGGGLAVVRNSGVAGRILSTALQDNTIVGTVARPNRAVYGGGIYAAGGTLLVRDSTIQYNAATLVNGTTESDGGGGIQLDDRRGAVAATLLRTTVAGNAANQAFGGGIGIRTDYQNNHGDAHSLAITDSTIAGNTARVGGGVAFGSGPSVLTNTTISGNIAQDYGGGMFLDIGGGGSKNDLVHVTITGNAAGEGGGFRGISTVHGTFRGSIIAGNSAGGSQTAAAADCYGVVPCPPYFTSVRRQRLRHGGCPRRRQIRRVRRRRPPTGAWRTWG